MPRMKQKCPVIVKSGVMIPLVRDSDKDIPESKEVGICLSCV